MADSSNYYVHVSITRSKEHNITHAGKSHFAAWMWEKRKVKITKENEREIEEKKYDIIIGFNLFYY